MFMDTQKGILVSFLGVCYIINCPTTKYGDEFDKDQLSYNTQKLVSGALDQVQPGPGPTLTVTAQLIYTLVFT